MWGTQRDITEQKRIERALRASEERFRFMGDAAPSHDLGPAASTRGTVVQRQWLRFLAGRAIEKLVMAEVQNRSPDDAGQCLETGVRGVRRARPFQIEYRLRRHDGVYRWVLDTASPWTRRRASPVLLFVALYRHRRPASAKPRRVPTSRPSSNQSDDAILSKDLDGTIRSCNAAAQRLFGYSAEKVRARPARANVHSADRVEREKK